jgi:hypothetical protein
MHGLYMLVICFFQNPPTLFGQCIYSLSSQAARSIRKVNEISILAAENVSKFTASRIKHVEMSMHWPKVQR